MLDLASSQYTDCFVFAEMRLVDGSKKQAKYSEMFQTLFPELKVLFRINGCTIHLRDINTALAD